MKRRGFAFPLLLLVVFPTVLLFSPGAADARTVKGIEFPEEVTIDGKTCRLNGVGVRKKFVISVYAGGLYMEKPTGNPSEVISSEQVKRVSMRFIYKEVRADQLVEAWNEGFEKNAGKAVSSLKAKISRFNAFFDEPVRKGESVELTYIPGRGTEVKIKGRVRGVVEGSDFMRALFSVWFGPNPPSEALKKGMLGK